MDKDTLADAKEAFKRASEAEADQREDMLDDLKFARLGEQWHETDRKNRERDGRPCLTINRMPSFIKQVTNDARQNRPSIKTHPVGNGADRETSDILDGLIRNIEYQSNAEVAYDTALDFAASCGIGYILVRADYATDDSWDLDLVIERVANPFSVYGDPSSTAADSGDWNDAFVTQMLRASEFKRRFPGASEASWKGDKDQDSELWWETDSIRLAERWKREQVATKLLKLSSGALMMLPEFEKVKELLQAQAITVEGERDTKTWKVTQQIMTGAEVLEENPWRGKYIPVIPVYGEEVNVEGKRRFLSLVRFAKDAQRMYNYWRTSATEMVALAPRTPFIGPEGAFETDSDKWATANTQSHPFIQFDGAVPPQRQPFSGVPAGDLQMALSASDDMKDVMGIHDASLGVRSNETSGRAIMARQREGDVSTYNFIDNLSRAIKHTGRILVDLIPKHYDVPRIVRCIKEDGTNYQVPINQPAIQQPVQQGQPPQYQASPEEIQGVTKVFDLTAGKYDVTCEAGPSFTTRREEAAFQMTELVRAFPQVFPIIGDLLAKNLDWPNADEVSERLKAMLPPQAQGQNPQVMQMQQGMQQMQQQIAQMDQALKDKSADHAIDQEKNQIAREKVGVDKVKAEADLLKTKMEMAQQQLQAQQLPDIGQLVQAIQQIGQAVQELQADAGEDKIGPALEQFAQSQQQVEQGIQQLAAEVQELAKLVTAPRKIIKQAGRAVAVQIGDQVRPISRGADGSVEGY